MYEEKFFNTYEPNNVFRVEVSLDHFSQPLLDVKEENDVDVPLPTDQVSRS